MNKRILEWDERITKIFEEKDKIAKELQELTALNNNGYYTGNSEENLRLCIGTPAQNQAFYLFGEYYKAIGMNDAMAVYHYRE